MPKLIVDVPDEIADRLTAQADALLLRRNAYLRAVVAAVAAQAGAEALEREQCPHCGAGRQRRPPVNTDQAVR